MTQFYQDFNHIQAFLDASRVGNAKYLCHFVHNHTAELVSPDLRDSLSKAYYTLYSADPACADCLYNAWSKSCLAVKSQILITFETIEFLVKFGRNPGYQQ